MTVFFFMEREVTLLPGRWALGGWGGGQVRKLVMQPQPWEQREKWVEKS